MLAQKANSLAARIAWVEEQTRECCNWLELSTSQVRLNPSIGVLSQGKTEPGV
jgi:hypothetical protein